MPENLRHRTNLDTIAADRMFGDARWNRVLCPVLEVCSLSRTAIAEAWNHRSTGVRVPFHMRSPATFPSMTYSPGSLGRCQRSPWAPAIAVHQRWQDEQSLCQEDGASQAASTPTVIQPIMPSQNLPIRTKAIAFAAGERRKGSQYYFYPGLAEEGPYLYKRSSSPQETTVASRALR